MKILIVSPLFFPTKDVGSFRMSALTDFVIGEGEEVIVIRNKDNSIFDEAIPYRNLKKIKEIKIEAKGNYFKVCEAYKKLIIKCCKRYHIDLVIYSCGPFYAMLIASQVKKIIGVPYIIDIRDFWIKNDEESIGIRFLQYIAFPIKCIIEYRAFKAAENVVVVSEGMLNTYVKFFSKFKDKFRVIPNGYDDQRYMGTVIESEKMIEELESFQGLKIGISGALSQYSEKYTMELLKALDFINKNYKNIKLFHMGKREEKIEALLCKCNINKNIYSYLGYFANENCIQILKTMDINVIINRRTSGLGTKLWDYLYVKKPILYVGNKEAELAKFLAKNICDNKDEIISILMENVFKEEFDNNYDAKIYARSTHNKKYYNLIKSIFEQ